MEYIQQVTPNVNVWGYSGGCLQYVDDGVNPPKRQATAQISWDYAVNTGTAHPNEQPPKGVWVPVYYSIDNGQWAGYGHIAWYYSDGNTTKIYDSEYGAGIRVAPYSSHQDLFNYMGWQMRYYGWSEAVDGLTIVKPKPKEEPKPEEEVNLDMYIIKNLNKNTHYICDGFNARWIRTERELNFYLGKDGHNKIKFPYTQMYDPEFRAIYPKPKESN
nr:MAG TPA: hypothetical protein [Caudoviricetes sp.]